MLHLVLAQQTKTAHVSKDKMQGYSLIEIIMVLAIFSISLTVVGPNINRFIAHNQIIAQINQINAIIKSARHQAIDNQDTVTLCPSKDYSVCNMDWNDPMIGFIDRNRNLYRDNQETLLFASQAILPTTTLTGPRGPIRFHETGINSSAATLLLCPKSGDVSLAKALFVSFQGRVRISKDNNKDGIDDRSQGRNVECL